MAAIIQDAIMLFGDSITQAGWTDGGVGARLANVYSRKFDVLNRGLAGYNTEWAIPVLEQCLANQQDQPHAAKIRILVIWFGANDATISSSPQHVPLPKFIENTKRLVNLVQSPESPYYSPSTRVILITPPPLNSHQRPARDPPVADRTFEITKEYAEGVKEAAAATKVSVVDVWTAIWKAAGENEASMSAYLSDGLHLKPEGYAVVYKTLMKTIKEEHADLHYENLGSVFPSWNLVDRADPGPSVQRIEI
ncbi:SGNH hydrolase-type esterase domain-containing protein [Mycena rosella]|uniref:SGNH hydrolase-type esterase domain-containing protein n=1 Tax=Mycena rosella TaxID=1033263 RepID=A0AAD7GGS8_MYCRO|nr:SGNH hydrolase-type esterase domain-containing protein [Mycena rosella]